MSWLLALLTFISIAHAETVDRRFIEMPFGPAAHESVLPIQFQYNHARIDSLNRRDSMSLDLEYQRSLNDEFALVWAPLPLGLIVRDPSQVGIQQSAFRWSLGLAQGGLWGERPRFNGHLR